MLFWKLLSLIELIVILIFLTIIIQKIRYDISLSEYETFDCTVIDTGWDYVSYDRRLYHTTVKFKFGTIKVYHKNIHAFSNNEQIKLRIKVKKDHYGNIIKVCEKKVLLIANDK